jgi:hypothetical protein
MAGNEEKKAGFCMLSSCQDICRAQARLNKRRQSHQAGRHRLNHARFFTIYLTLLTLPSRPFRSLVNMYTALCSTCCFQTISTSDIHRPLFHTYGLVAPPAAHHHVRPPARARGGRTPAPYRSHDEVLIWESARSSTRRRQTEKPSVEDAGKVFIVGNHMSTSQPRGPAAVTHD